MAYCLSNLGRTSYLSGQLCLKYRVKCPIVKFNSGSLNRYVVGLHLYTIRGEASLGKEITKLGEKATKTKGVR